MSNDKQSEPVAFLRVKSGKIVGSSVNDEMVDGIYSVYPHESRVDWVNNKMYNALKMIMDDPESLEGRPRTFECVMEALQAVKTLRGESDAT